MKITIGTEAWGVTSTNLTTLEDLLALLSMAQHYQIQYEDNDEDVEVVVE